MASTDSTTVLGWLKAAGEDSRLRLLALCAGQELSVSDLAEALRQSEPRVSRHLKILCDAGLLERMRQGQWVHYRVTQDGAAAAFVRSLLGQMDRGDALFAQDRDRAARPAGAAAAGARTLESGLGRALKGFVEAVDVAIAEGASGRGREGHDGRVGRAGSDGVAGSGESGAALVVGVEHLELLETAVAVAGRCVAIAHSRRAAQSARTFAERRGLACRVLLAASPNALCEKDIEAATERLATTERPARESPAGRESRGGAGAAFDVVFLDHLARPDSSLEGMLEYGRRALAANGRLWVFERYEALAHGSAGTEKVVEHPIGRLRRLLGDVGLSCERLSPIETEGQHVIAAVALPSRGASWGTGTTAAGAA
jgi:DNA-binding transcriptional ArsR family regulator